MELPKAEGNQPITIKIVSALVSGAITVVDELQKKYSIRSLDFVIANAGIAIGVSTVRKTTVKNMNQHFALNTVGPITLFQATADL